MGLEKDYRVGFLMHTAQHISPFLVYLVVGILLCLESTGVPIVNTTLLLCVGAVASQGHLEMVLLLPIAILGSILGACCAYGLGRRYGQRPIVRLARLLHIDERKILLVQNWIQTSGIRIIFLSRIIPYIRPFACFPAGIACMPFQRFFWSALIGSIIWCLTILIIGWELGPRWKLAMNLIQTYTWPAIVLLVVLLIVGFFCRRWLTSYVNRRVGEEGKRF